VTTTAKGTFDIVMTPGTPEVAGAVGRFDFTKTFHGDLDATGVGVMLSHGDPQTGAAGYVAIETVNGRLGDRSGSFARQQFGMMQHGSRTLHYEVVPGSGHGELAGLSGAFHLKVEEDGAHRFALTYEV
jgi:hypothetical protein